ncbi:hypothetical protein BGX30_007990 [Mortierella sp. GBA39]|nr:hypothetical protein BGX30_007990 [Mortierella sp. GBA39]
MMSVRLSVGQGLKDFKHCPSKSICDMVSDLPLALYNYHFENVEWQCQTEIDLVNDNTPLGLYRTTEA